MGANKLIWPILTALAASGSNVTEAAVPASSSAAFPTPSAAAELTPAGANAYTFALKLIAQQKFSAAAAILGGLAASGSTPAAVVNDYLYALEQVKDYPEIVRYYENRSTYPFTGQHYFVIGCAYAQLGNWQEAHALFTKSAAAGYTDAKLKAVSDLDTAILRAYKEGRAAEIPPLQDKLAKILNAAGEPEQALSLIKPKIADNTASPSAQVTYISSLYIAGHYENVLSEAARLWTGRTDMPPEVQLAVADANKRLNRISEAAAGYQALLGLQPDNLAAKAGKAYALLYTGKISDGMALYEQSLTREPSLISAAMQDATALIENKQTAAGRLLFEKILALYPDKPEYGQRYAEVLYANNLPRMAQQVQAKTLGMADVSAGETRQTMHDRAVALARSQQFAESLAIFKTLYTNNPNDQKVFFDYVTVLAWSGSLDAAIELYERLGQVETPEYVRRNIAGAYYQTGQYTKALKLYQQLAGAGDRQAKLKLAEIQFKIGDRQAADRLFNELIAENPRDFEVLVARGSLYAGLGNHRLALQDYEKALRLVSAASVSENAVRDLHDRLAAAYINLGQNEQAISLLQRYINTNTASLSMQGNYILALRGSGQYRLAIAEGNRLWPEFASGPLFGLRAIAESYVQLNNTIKAVEVYNHILSRSPEDVDARFGLAFSLMLEGRIIEGLGAYEKLIAENPQRKGIALNDADMMLATNRFLAGKALYDHLLRRFPDNSMRQQYAEALARHRHNRAAFKQYTILAQSPESEYVGLAGQVKTSLALQDYRQARIAYEALSSKYGRSSAVAVLSEIYSSRPQGDLYNSFVYNTSHKNLRTQDWQSSAEQNLADNYWLSVHKGRTRLDDFSIPQEYRILNSTGVGLRYQDINGSISLRTAHIASGNSLATYAFTTERRLTDQTTLSLAYGKDVLRDVQALNSADGSIMTRTFGLGLARELSPKESFNLSLNRTAYSDENRSTAFSLEHNYLLYDRNNRALSRSLYWNRNYFHRESPLYESPSLRESLGASWLLRRSFANSYWQTRLTANWAHDLPDSLTFEPYLRCEWGRDFSASHALAIGAEYGLRSQSIFGSGLKYGYHQLDFVYRIRW